MKSTKWEEAHQLSYPLELIRKHVSQMFFRGEVEQELRETGRDFTFQSDADMEGCGLAWAVDGNWKLTFPVCMFPV
jgi:hypothetical protein